MIDEPVPTTCWPCQGIGYRGMDRCNWCDTTGSVFVVGGERFPNTKKGYEEAKKKLAAQEPWDARCKPLTGFPDHD